MSLLALGARDRRAIVLGAAVLVPTLLFAAVVRPYRAALADAREQLAAERALLADELALLVASERYPTAYGAADSALLSTTPRLFSEADDVLATAQLASYVAGQALSSRALVHEWEPLPARRLPEGLRVLEVELRVESDLEGILRFLDVLERGAKLVVVDDVSITRGERPQERGRPAMPILTMRATVRGFALVESPGIAERGHSVPGAQAEAP